MTKKPRVPAVLWKLFQNRARTLAETMLSIIPPPSSQCRCKGRRLCIRCCSIGERMSFLIREDDPSDYSKFLNQCFVVVSDNAPSPPSFDPHSRWSQLEIVRMTIEMMSSENMICTGYNKQNRSSTIVEALTSASWSLLLKRVGDGLMVYILNYYSIFIPLHRKKHQQVAGIPINELCWKLIKQTSESKNQHPSSDEVDSVSVTVDTPESSSTCLGCNVKGSVTHMKQFSKMSCHQDFITDADCNKTTQENGFVGGAHSGKRFRSYAWQRRHKRRKLSSQNMCEYDANSSLPQEKKKLICSCCSVWKTLNKVPKKAQISKQSMLYKLEHMSSILPGKHIINSLKPNVAGANALFKEVFGLSDTHSTICSHSKYICVIGNTCLYHSLHKLLKSLIRKAIHCPRVQLLKKHILDQKDLFCSKGQVVSFIWAASRSIVPQELLGSPSTCRILRKNISTFIRLRLYEKFSLHQCMDKLKISKFTFVSNDHSLCNKFGEVKQRLLGRWIYWFFTCLIVPLIQANFYVTESEHGKLDVFFYEKSLWKKLMKTSVSSLKEENCYSLLHQKNVEKILRSSTFGFSRVRFCPKSNGIRPLANLKSSSRFPGTNRYFKAVNTVLRDLHAALKDIQLKSPKKLGSSVFSYNDVHRKLRGFLTCVKNGLDNSPCVYMVVADVAKAYDSIDQNKLLQVMEEVITDNHLLHETQNVTISKKNIQISNSVNLSRQFRSYFHAPSSHSIFLDQGIRRIARKEDLLSILKQHVKSNVLNMDNKFYLQNVGIPQGSILSSLLCSFYYGHMESKILVPFIDESTKMGISESSSGGYFGQDLLLLRLIDDFLFISTSKKKADAFLTRVERGFFLYNCNMNTEKFGSSFDADKITESSNRIYFDKNSNKFMRWSGLLVNCKTLEVQADYTRYLDGHISSTITVSWHGNPVRHFMEKLCNYLRPKCHAIFYDSKINSASVVRLNIHQAFLVCAMKFHCYVRDFSNIRKFDSGSYMKIIHNSFSFMYKLMKKRMYSVVSDDGSRPILKVKRGEVEWLGLRAYFEVLKRKQGRYKEVLSLLELKLKLKSVDVGRVSPALKFAVDKSNSLVVWKIKY